MKNNVYNEFLNYKTNIKYRIIEGKRYVRLYGEVWYYYPTERTEIIQVYL